MKKLFFKSTVLVLSLFLIFSCKNNRENFSMQENVSEENFAYADSANPTSKIGFSSKRAAQSVSQNSTVEFSQNDSQIDITLDRKLIKNGSASIEVTSLSEIQSKMEAFVKIMGGYISNSNWNERNAYVTIRIPSAKFDEAMNTLSDFGKIKNQNIYSNDVTDEFYDLESRIETKKILRDKLSGYLKQAGNIKDILEIERQLNEVMSDLDSIESRMKRLSKQIELSTINLDFSLPIGKTEQGFSFPSFSEKARNFLLNVVDFVQNFFWGICYVLVFGIPIVLIIFLFYWILFGKVGLLKKLFKRLK